MVEYRIQGSPHIPLGCAQVTLAKGTLASLILAGDVIYTREEVLYNTTTSKPRCHNMREISLGYSLTTDNKFQVPEAALWNGNCLYGI